MSNTNRTMLTTKTITEDHISRLRVEALAANDYAMAAICDVYDCGGIDTDDYTCLTAADAARIGKLTRDGALVEIVDAINAARAQED